MTIEENIPLRDKTTFKVGGLARYFTAVSSVDEAREAIAFAAERGVPYFIMGGGSNLLVSDDGFPGLVVQVAIKGRAYEASGRTVRATIGAGESWDGFVAEAVDKGLWGIENLSGIPGTVGAAPVQNIGAYGVEAQSVIESVEVYDVAAGASRTMTNAECEFGYRTSYFKRPGAESLVILSVTFVLKKDSAPKLGYKDLQSYFAAYEDVLHPSIEHIREAVLEIRAGKFPDLSVFGTAGSFFKNPVISETHFAELSAKYPNLPQFPAGDRKVKVPLAWILDKVCGLKGHAHGKAALYEFQPLVLVALPGCTSFEVESLADHVARLVRDKTGIVIEREVVSLP